MLVWPISRVNMLHLREPESHTRTWHPAGNDLSASALREATARAYELWRRVQSAFRFFSGAASGLLGFRGRAAYVLARVADHPFSPARGSDWISLSSDCERALQRTSIAGEFRTQCARARASAARGLRQENACQNFIKCVRYGQAATSVTRPVTILGAAVS